MIWSTWNSLIICACLDSKIGEEVDYLMILEWKLFGL